MKAGGGARCQKKVEQDGRCLINAGKDVGIMDVSEASGGKRKKGCTCFRPWTTRAP